MSVEKDLWVFNAHLTALDAKIGKYDMEIENSVLSIEEDQTNILKEVELCLSEAEEEIEKSRERLDKGQGQGPSTPNYPVASETCGDFGEHMKKEVKQMESNHSFVLWKWYRCRRIIVRSRQDLGKKLETLRCLSIHYSQHIELELLNELEEIRVILLQLKAIMCAPSTDTSETPGSNEQMNRKSRPLQNFTNKNVNDARKEITPVRGKHRIAQKTTLPRWK